MLVDVLPGLMRFALYPAVLILIVVLSFVGGSISVFFGLLLNFNFAEILLGLLDRWLLRVH